MKKLITTMLLALSTVIFAGESTEFSNPNPVQRANAAQRAGYSRDATAVAALTKMLADAEPKVAYAAAQALAAIGSAPAAEALLAAMKGGQAAVVNDAALRCAEARRVAGDEKQGQALLTACYASGKPPITYAALIALATVEPAKYASAIEAALTSGDALRSAAAVKAVKASAALVPTALKALNATQDEAKARVIGALAAHASQPQVKAALVAALSDDSEPVRVAALHAAVVAQDRAALPAMWSACSKGGEEGQVARLMFEANGSAEVDPFLYSQMKAAESRVLAIELLGARHHPELIKHLCEASLYTDKAVAQAAAGALRTMLQAPQLTQVMTFVFTALPSAQRAPFVSALAAVVQQLPDIERSTQEISALFKTLPNAARIDALPVVASLQTPPVCQLLVDESKNAEPEYRKEIVRTLAKWSQPTALGALVNAAQTDADSSIKILALRGALILMDKKGVADGAEKLTVLSALIGAAERDAEKHLLYARLKGESGKEAEPMRKALAQELQIDETETIVVAINLGGPAVGYFQADTGAEGGQPYQNKGAIDLSGAMYAAPEEVYQSSRYQNCAYRFQGLTPNGEYTLRLHYAELFHKKPGGRAGDVVVNGVKIIDNLPSAEYCKAFTVTKAITADAAGKVVIELKTTRDQVKVNGFEIIATGKNQKAPAAVTVAPPPAMAVKAPTPGKINILLLTGANNHNWKETTAALSAIFDKAPQFAVTVVEK
ncbi:MAG: HEAT repeat domain-containing protein [Kiritimatiellae bacterium]|nr:HEAT repeat domain-containing protein [Kiritimatiellia bacterium]